MKLLSLSIKADELEKLSAMFAKGMAESAFPNTAQAIRQSKDLVRQRWADYLAGEGNLEDIEPLEKPSVKMAQSVKAEKTSTFGYSIYSENREMLKLIDGEPAIDYDMKRTHPYGRKSRVSKKGVPYLIVNFRWATPNSKGGKRAHWSNFIPQKFYQTTLNKVLRKHSEATGGTHTEPNFAGQEIDRTEYNWGGRLSESDAWDDRSAGMVRMKDIAGGGSTYFTFRVISAKSPQGSWLYHKDAKPPIDILGALKHTVQGDIERMVDEGIKADAEIYKNGL